MRILKGTIELEEYVDEVVQYASYATTEARRYWIATIDGKLGKGRVIMSRKGDRAGEALANLRQAVKDEGWLLEERA